MTVSLDGIDVSKWQGTIDWEKVKASGIEFAMIKIGNIWKTGELGLDERFSENIRGALSAGLRVGVYAYTYTRTPLAARTGAQNVCAALAVSHELITLPVAFDMEEQVVADTGRDNCRDMAAQWRDEVAANGFVPCLYVNPTWLRKYITVPGGMKLWLAHWDVQKPYCDAYIWQYSAEGKVDGIDGNVDLNRGFFDDGELEEELVVKSKVTSAATVTYSPNTDIDYLALAGVISSPDVWHRIVCGEIQPDVQKHVIPLLHKFTDVAENRDKIITELQELLEKHS